MDSSTALAFVVVLVFAGAIWAFVDIRRARRRYELEEQAAYRRAFEKRGWHP
jgi:hypothetical protein